MSFYRVLTTPILQQCQTVSSISKCWKKKKNMFRIFRWELDVKCGCSCILVISSRLENLLDVSQLYDDSNLHLWHACRNTRKPFWNGSKPASHSSMIDCQCTAEIFSWVGMRMGGGGGAYIPQSCDFLVWLLTPRATFESKGTLSTFSF